MKYSLEKNNNSKKIIIGVSILFCAVILIVGGTLAFFTGSDTKNLDDVATSNVTLDYKDNTTYMRNNLIPVVEGDVTKFASKNLINSTDERKYTDEDICHYKDDMYACSLYEFTITNTASISQNIIVSMTPIINEYNNFYFILYESKANELNNELNKIVNNTKIELDTINFDNTNVILKPEESKTYTIVFYIKSLDIPQDDANKRFTASILVNSITTGYKKVVQLGEGCYDFEMLEDNTLKLTKFNGINHETGDIVEGCGVTKDEDGLYSVTVPSLYAGVAVSTLGNSLFYPIDLENYSQNDLALLMASRHFFIKELIINEGITTIEDGVKIEDDPTLGNLSLGLLTYVGYNVSTQQPLNDEGVMVKLPNSLKYIGRYAFISSYIKEIDLPNSLEYIGNSSFDSMQLTTMSIPASVQIIGNGAFGYNKNLKTLTFEEGSKLTTIGNGAFQYSDIQSLVIPNSVKTIEASAFSSNENLTTLTFEEGSKLTTIGNSAFSGSQLTELTLGNNVQTIGDSAFYNSQLTTLTLGDNVQTIGNYAFSGSQLTELTLGDNVQTIGEYAFSSSQLTELIIPNSVQTIGYGAFYNSKLTTLTLGNNVQTIGGGAFYKSQLTTLAIPNRVQTIEDYAFSLSQLTELTLGNSVQTIGDWAFGCSKLTELTIPNSVQTIGDRAFENSKLTELILGENVQTIGYYAFSSSQLTELIIPNSVQTIGENAFRESQLTTLTLGDNVQTIGEYAFRSSQLTTLAIPNSVQTIGNYAFYNSRLTTLTLGDNVQTIGEWAFYNSQLTTLTLGDNVKTIGNNAFQNSKLTRLTLGNSVQTIGNYAFYNSDLTYLSEDNPLIIPSSVTSIGSNAFWSDPTGTDDYPGNRNLKYIKFKGKLKEDNPTDWYNSNNTTLITTD